MENSSRTAGVQGTFRDRTGSTLLPLAVAFLAIAGGLYAQDPPLVAERDWTSDDGKRIRASLIGFERGQGQFRTPEGRRFVIPDERFSLRDQVPIFVARIKSQLDESYSKDINTDFYYSKHIPANKRREKNYSYVSFGPGRFNLAFFLNDPQTDFHAFDEVVVRGPQDTELAVYRMGESDRGTLSRNGKETFLARISINHGQQEEVLKALETALESDELSFSVRGKGGEKVFTVDESERNSLRETIAIFRQASNLITAGFLKKDRLENQEIDEPDSPALPNDTSDPLEPFRSQLSQSKYGDLKWNSETVNGLGFLGTDVVVKKTDGEIVGVPFSELSKEDRALLFEKRLEETFGESRFEYDTGTKVYLHPDWDTKRMIYCQAILLVHHSDGKHYLRANAWTSRLNGAPVTEIFVRGNQQEKPFPVACLPNESQFRPRSDGGSNTVPSAYLGESELEAARDLVGSESIEFRICSENETTSATLKDDELHITRESVALYQWARQL